MRTHSKASVRAFYSEVLQDGKETAENLQDPPCERFLSALSSIGKDAPRLALDLGYGAGRYAVALARAGYDVVAVDQAPSGPLVRRLREEGAWAEKISVREALIEDYLIDGVLGVAVLRDVLHYLSKWDAESVLRRVVTASASQAMHYLTVFTGISRTSRDGQQIKIEGEAEFSAEEFEGMIARVYEGWALELSWEKHAEHDTRSGRRYFEAFCGTVIAHRRVENGEAREGNS